MSFIKMSSLISVVFISITASAGQVQSHRFVPCEWNAKQTNDKSPSTEKVKSQKELSKFMSTDSNCDLKDVNWKKEWVYLYQLSCPGMNDELKVRDYRKGVLSVLHLKPEAKCNSTSVCGSQGIAVIFSKKETIHTVSLEKQMVPCSN